MIFNKHLIHRDGKEEILQEKNFKMRHKYSEHDKYNPSSKLQKI